jgi:hypothetical protein
MYSSLFSLCVYFPSTKMKALIGRLPCLAYIVSSTKETLMKHCWINEEISKSLHYLDLIIIPPNKFALLLWEKICSFGGRSKHYRLPAPHFLKVWFRDPKSAQGPVRSNCCLSPLFSQGCTAEFSKDSLTCYHSILNAADMRSHLSFILWHIQEMCHKNVNQCHYS